MISFFKKVPIVLILSLTLVLMVFIGYGEARRTYYFYRVETTILQSETFLDIISPFVEAGFPLTMYSGYDGMAQVYMESNDDLHTFIVLDPYETVVFHNQRSPLNDNQIFQKSMLELDWNENVTLMESKDYFRIERQLPKDRNNQSGVVEFYLSKKVSQQRIMESYKLVFYCLGGAIFLLALTFFILTSKKRRKTEVGQKLSDSLLRLFYLMIFVLLAAVVTFTTIQIYNTGVRGKANAVGTLLARRLYPVKDLGVRFEDLTGVDTILSDFRDRYDMIESVSLITSEIGAQSNSGVILYDSNPIQRGENFTPDLNRFLVFDAPLGESGSTDVQERLIIKISVPRKEINRAILNSLITFSALLIGCGLISMIFLNVGLSYASYLARTEPGEKADFKPNESLQLIKAAYFLVVFISAMAVPFLPMLVSELNGGTISSLPFMVYYMTFALVLIPSGNFAAAGKIKQTMGIGFFAELVGGLLIASSSSLLPLTLGRAMCGVGQGFFLIGFQSYVLSVTPPEKRTQGAAIKVIARNSALIAGTAIGALLYVFMGYRNLFILSAGMSLLGFIYLILMVPQTGTSTHFVAKKLELKNISYVFKDKGFLKVLLLTGIPAKMGITGVVNFAVPLLLGFLGYSTEAIGRLLMLFFITSMVTTQIASKSADRRGNTTGLLFFSSLVGGLGMIAMGYQSLILSQQNNIVTLVGLLFIGVSNGLISAPIVTQITLTKSSDHVGHSSMIAVYTFLERFGHIMGPGLVSFLIVLSGNDTAKGIGLFGVGTVTLGLLFLMITRKKDFSGIVTTEKPRVSPASMRVKKKDGEIDMPGAVISLGIQLGGIPAEDLADKALSLASYYKKSLKHFHDIFAARDSDYFRTDSGSVLLQWPGEDALAIGTLCDRAVSFYKKNFVDKDSLVIEGMGIHHHDLILLNDRSYNNPISLNPSASFSDYLSKLNHLYGTSVLISESVKYNLGSRFYTRKIDRIEIPGSQGTTNIYELFGSPSHPATEQKIKFCEIYEKGYNLYLDQEFDKSLKYMEYLMEKTPHNRSVRKLYYKLLLVQKHPELIDVDWDGIIN